MNIEKATELRTKLDELESVQCEISTILELQKSRFQKTNLQAVNSGTTLIELNDGDRFVILEALLTRRQKRENDLKKYIEHFEK